MTEGASGEFADNLLIGWYLLITADTLCQFYEALPPIGIEKGMALRGTISGNQIGFAPAGSLRLGAAPQATSLPEGGIMRRYAISVKKRPAEGSS